MRGLRITISVVAVAALTAGCWADFPDSRFELDATSQPDINTQDIPLWDDQGQILDQGPDQGPLADQGPQPDNALVDMPLTPDLPVSDGFTCTPDAFVGCATKDQLLRCNKKGDGTVTESCKPNLCNATAKRCDECKPGSKPTCSGSNLIGCSSVGLKTTTPCALNCKGGVCCLDGDKDTHTDCDGDCNDADDKVYPGATDWHTTASGGSFDYNCDNKSDRQYPNPVNCTMSGGKCGGDGWTGTVPACGAFGQLTTCVKQGNKCEKGTTSPIKQGCR